MRTRTATIAALGLLAGCEWLEGGGPQRCEALSGPVDNVLVLEDRCYLVEDTLRVTGALDVPPGADLRFSDDAGLVVEQGGSLTAGGDPGRPTRFRGDNWRGVDVLEDGTASLSGVSIEGGGFRDSACEGPTACLHIDKEAVVDLQEVGFEGCAGAGVEGPLAFGQNVGCGDIGLCFDEGNASCVTGTDVPVHNDDPDWCAMYDWCEDPDEIGLETQHCGDAGPGDSRCAGSVIESCIDGTWTELTDCARFTGGRTACRNPDGFPRCGMPAPTECLNKPELPGGSFVPPCDDEGCHQYEAACMGVGEAASCNESTINLEGCLHPETASGGYFSGLGPQWMRFIIYNWGGKPDTSPGYFLIRFFTEGDHRLTVWAPPRDERRFCAEAWTAIPDPDQGGYYVDLALPPAGEQYEIVLEVHPSPESVDRWTPRTPDGHLLTPVALDADSEPLYYRTHEAAGSDDIYPLCERVDEVLKRAADRALVRDLCVNNDGRFESRASGELADGWPDMSTPRAHVDPSRTTCKTWDLSIEYIDD